MIPRLSFYVMLNPSLIQKIVYQIIFQIELYILAKIYKTIS